MATGYTHRLKQSNFDVASWLMNCLPGAFDVGMFTRDDSREFTSPDEFQAAIEEAAHSDFDHYERRLLTSVSRQEELNEMTDEDWQNKYASDVAEEKSRVKKSQEEYWEERAGYLAALDRIRSIKSKILTSSLSAGDRERSEGILKFAEDQITETIKHDCEEGDEPTLSSMYEDGWKEYRDLRLNAAEKSVEWTRKNLKEEYERQQERISGYESYARFIKAAFEEEEVHV